MMFSFHAGCNISMGRGDGEERYLLKKSPYEDSFFWMLIELTVGINGLLVKESKR